ncbi:MAG TPA: hypothetical protein PLW94_02405 [Candidatus Absconditabacterales bacterium]|nr:hypothetical protein [Candidatus Absconditabacterales bacterium]
MNRDKYINERIKFYKNLVLLSKSTLITEAKSRSLDVKTTNTKGVIIQKILDDEFPY